MSLFHLKYNGLYAGFKIVFLLGPELTSDREDECVEEAEYNCTESLQDSECGALSVAG